MKSPEDKIRDIIENLRHISIRKDLMMQLNTEMELLKSELENLHQDFENKIVALNQSTD